MNNQPKNCVNCKTEFIGAFKRCEPCLVKGREANRRCEDKKRGGPPAPRTKINLQYCKDFAETKGWKLLSKTYAGVKTPMTWRCDKGHQWDANFHNIKDRKTNCPYCLNCNLKYNIEDIRTLAEKNNGKLVSDVYINKHTKLIWECDKGHQFEMAPHSIDSQQQWCPYCLYKDEAFCREFIQKVLQCTMFKCRPKFLNGLELDGYNEELKLAFEYSGIQHFKFIPFFHKTPEGLDKQILRDNEKAEICKQMNINLLVIPYTYSIYIDKNKLEAYILDYLYEHKYIQADKRTQ